MNKTRKLVFISILLMLVFFVTGCSTRSNKSFTYNVETGDSVKVKLDTSKGYDLDSDLPFTISKDGEKLTKGKFITLYGYEETLELLEENSDISIIDSGKKDGNEYTFFSYNDEYIHLIKVKDSKTGIYLYNTESEDSAKECFERLTFTLE